MEYKISNHSVFNINYHIVFCPKYRKPILIHDIKDDCEKIIREVLSEMKCEIKELQIMPDHVHLFVSALPNISPHIIVKNIKGRTAQLRRVYPQIKKIPTMWSRSYYIGSVGHVQEETVKNYIKNQKKV